MQFIRTIKNWLDANRVTQGPMEPASEMTEELKIASELWSQRAREQAEQIKPSSWTECPVVIEEYMNPLISGNGKVGWLEAVARDYFPQPVANALSLGCGGGGLERHGLQLGIARHFDAFDVSAGAIELARGEAEKSNQAKNINYRVTNLNKLEFEHAYYDAAFASQSVHHIQALEHYMAQVWRALKTGGLFIVNEFVGPNQFQWTDAQLSHAQRLLDQIPPALRHCIREPGVRHKVERPTIEFMNGFDPTEAIRSGEIVQELGRRFEIVERRDFGGTLLHLVLDNIAGNLSESDTGKQLLRSFFAEERRLIASGEIGSDFTLIVARKV